MTVHPRNILVMDGDAGYREYACAALARASYRSLGVADSQAALQAARDEDVDVALLDLGELPDARGLWLARRLRAEVRDLPVVLLTQAPSLDTALDAMRVGVLDYLFKPFSTADLVEAVDRAVAWRRRAVRQRAGLRQVEQETVSRMARLHTAIADAAIASAPALDLLLSHLYTRNRPALEHARRVSRHASGLGAALGMAGPRLETVRRAGLLHDIGKLALPERITAKPTPLTDDERTLFRTHTELGAALLRETPMLAPAAEIVGALRERYDGSGYPAGLRHDAIPIGSRIVAIAESFDSLTGGGLGDDPVSVAAANAELVRAAGTRFDPAVVAAWMRYADADLLQAIGRDSCGSGA